LKMNPHVPPDVGRNGFCYYDICLAGLQRVHWKYSCTV
jgi:hypothetical protein